MRRCLTCDSTDINAQWQCEFCKSGPTEVGNYKSFVDPSDQDDDGFEGSFFARLASVEAGFWWFEARNELIVWALRRWCDSATSLLEVGCGTGFVISRIARDFPRLRTSASEIFADAMPIVGRRSGSTALYQFDARNIPFRNEFDVVGAFDVLEHIDDDVDALREIRQALRSDGYVIVTVPQHRFLWSEADEFAHHKRRYTRSSLCALLRKSGFGVVMMRSFVSFLMPALLASRLFFRRNNIYNPMAEFSISSATNRILMGVMEFERRLIESGMSLPFGGSLLAVATSTATPAVLGPD